MTVTIIRRTGWVGMATKVSLSINGEKTTKIGFHEQLELQLPAEKAVLSVSQFGSKSNKVEVKSGDRIELTTSLWTKISVFSFFLYIFMGTFLPSSVYTSGFSVLALFTLLAGLLLNSFHLEIVGR